MSEIGIKEYWQIYNQKAKIFEAKFKREFNYKFAADKRVKEAEERAKKAEERERALLTKINDALSDHANGK